MELLSYLLVSLMAVVAILSFFITPSTTLLFIIFLLSVPTMGVLIYVGRQHTK